MTAGYFAVWTATRGLAVSREASVGAATRSRRRSTLARTPSRAGVSTVPLPRAFELFTGQVNSWWPHQFHIGQAEVGDVILEPQVGGRWYECWVDGSECDWGRILAPGPAALPANEALGVAEHSGKSPDELVAMARDRIQPKGLTSLMGSRIALTDGMIHHQDIRRPFAMPREIPAARLIVALEVAKTAPTISATKRIKGLTLTATDLGWRTGDGPRVEGTGEALLMAIAGRRGIVAELSGPVVATLADRIGG